MLSAVAPTQALSAQADGYAPHATPTMSNMYTTFIQMLSAVGTAIAATCVPTNHQNDKSCGQNYSNNNDMDHFDDSTFGLVGHSTYTSHEVACCG
jgi:hypothetical protein